MLISNNNPPGTMPVANGGGTPGMRCPDTCDPVIGTNGNVYKNECYARMAGVEPIANALDRSICEEDITSVGEWLKRYWYIPAVVIAILILLRR